MKKITMITLFLSLLIFSLSAGVSAAVTTHLDYFFSDSESNHKIKGDIMSRLPKGNLYIGGDFYNFTINAAGNDENLNACNYKIGFPIIQNDQIELFGMFSLLSLDGNSATNNVSYSPILAGFILKYHFDEKMDIDGSVDYSVYSRDYKRDGFNTVDADFLAVKVRFNYLFTETIGVSLGYTWNQLDVDNKTTKDKGCTAGIIFRI
jgi:hypothetical protein